MGSRHSRFSIPGKKSMGSNLKHQKMEEDRISNLPTTLISHFLSSLPTKYAVRTSSLSTFWYQQWTSIAQLHFDDALAPETISTQDTKASFVNFVYRVLLHLKCPFPNVFQINCSQGYGVKHINSWVSAALSRHVQHIDFSFSNLEPGLLPRSLFSSRNLVFLKLGTGFLLKVPMSISLDSLKILHLSVKYSDNDSLSRLVSSCPVLEELKLQGTIGDNVNEIKISSVALKRLILIGLNPLSEPQSHSYQLVLNTPGLQYLELLDCCIPDSYSKEILHCLEIARIDVGQSYGDTYRRVCRALEFLFAKLSSTKFLHLSKNACKTLYRIPCTLPKFPRLIELELYEVHGVSLTAFLESSPKLETLSFQYSYEYLRWLACVPKSVPLCMVSSLKKVEIKNFSGQQNELNIVRYYLENSKCLNKLFLSFPIEIAKEREAEISKKLLMLPRASTSCIVVIT